MKHDDYSSDQQSGRNISKVLCDMEGACGICAGHGPPENAQSKGVPQSSLFLIEIMHGGSIFENQIETFCEV